MMSTMFNASFFHPRGQLVLLSPSLGLFARTSASIAAENEGFRQIVQTPDQRCEIQSRKYLTEKARPALQRPEGGCTEERLRHPEVDNTSS